MKTFSWKEINLVRNSMPKMFLMNILNVYYGNVCYVMIYDYINEIFVIYSLNIYVVHTFFLNKALLWKFNSFLCVYYLSMTNLYYTHYKPHAGSDPSAEHVNF